MDERKKRTKLSAEGGLALMQKFCAYQDRCQAEVRTRLIEHSIYGDTLEEIIADLIADDFINEERFAASYVSGKFKIKRWGRLKILKELKFRQISNYSIKKAMKQIDEEEYTDVLATLLTKKSNTLSSAKDKWEKKKKLTAFATQKGYEYDVIKNVLDDSPGLYDDEYEKFCD